MGLGPRLGSGGGEAWRRWRGRQGRQGLHCRSRLLGTIRRRDPLERRSRYTICHFRRSPTDMSRTGAADQLSPFFTQRSRPRGCEGATGGPCSGPGEGATGGGERGGEGPHGGPADPAADPVAATGGGERGGDLGTCHTAVTLCSSLTSAPHELRKAWVHRSGQVPTSPKRGGAGSGLTSLDNGGTYSRELMA